MSEAKGLGVCVRVRGVSGRGGTEGRGARARGLLALPEIVQVDRVGASGAGPDEHPGRRRGLSQGHGW